MASTKLIQRLNQHNPVVLKPIHSTIRFSIGIQNSLAEGKAKIKVKVKYEGQGQIIVNILFNKNSALEKDSEFFSPIIAMETNVQYTV